MTSTLKHLSLTCHFVRIPIKRNYTIGIIYDYSYEKLLKRISCNLHYINDL